MKNLKIFASVFVLVSIMLFLFQSCGREANPAPSVSTESLDKSDHISSGDITSFQFSDSVTSGEASEEESVDIPQESSEYEASEISEEECAHTNTHKEILKELSYYEDGTEATVCDSCGETVKVEKTTKITGKTEYTYDETVKIVNQFKSRYSIDNEVIGTTAEGRSIYAYRLGSPSAEHHILFHAGIHGKEYMNTALLLNMTEYYILNKNDKFKGKSFSEWTDDVCIHIIPSANPDGAAISQTLSASDKAAQILINRGIKSNLERYYKVWKANANGVDLNRNFNAYWDSYSDGIGKPNYRLYKGPVPESEPETKALVSYTKKYDFKATFSYHSFGETLYWKFGDDKKTIDLCWSLCEAVSSVTGYQPIDPSDAPAAGYKDWAILMGIPSLTVETGNVASPLPDEQYYTIWDDNKYVFAAVCEWLNNH